MSQNITSAPLRGAIKHPPQQKERTTKPKRRAPKGNAAEPLGVCLCDRSAVVFVFIVIGMLLCGGLLELQYPN